MPPLSTGTLFSCPRFSSLRVRHLSYRINDIGWHCKLFSCELRFLFAIVVQDANIEISGTDNQEQRGTAMKVKSSTMTIIYPDIFDVSETIEFTNAELDRGIALGDFDFETQKEILYERAIEHDADDLAKFGPLENMELRFSWKNNCLLTVLEPM